MPDPRALNAPATERNREAIATILERWLPAPPEHARVLEVSSGTGQHACYFAGRFPNVRWQPTERDTSMFGSIRAWIEDAGVANVAAPLELDVEARPWPVQNADVIVNINMIHIAPWSACLALLDGASSVLSAGGTLFMYGPYKIGGAHTAPSNEAFDRNFLRAQDPEWGVRDLDEVIAEARTRGLEHESTVEMPANNLSVIYRRR